MTTTATSTAVDRLLELIAAGRGADAAELYAPHALLDATVPGWRFQKRGPEAISAVWSGWFEGEGAFEEMDRMPTADGEVVRYLQTGVDETGPFAAHHCHIITLDKVTGLIVREQVWCGGRWYADRRAEMEEAQRREPVT
jgi:hypothetical protein